MLFSWLSRALCVCLTLFLFSACGWQPRDATLADVDPAYASPPPAVEAAKPGEAPPNTPNNLYGGARPQPAKTAPKRFHAYTNGIKCESLIAALGKKESEDRILLIIAGFMTGVNYAKGSDRPLDMKSMLMVTENFCRNNPGRNLTEALLFLDASLESSRAGGPGMSGVMPSAPVAPPAATQAPATATRVPATATKVPATATKVPATATKVPATATQAPATATKVPTAATRAPAVDPGGAYVVQVYSTNSSVEAGRVIELLQSEGFVARVEKVDLGNRGIWHRIVVGPYADAELAEAAAEKLRQKKFQTIVRQR